MWPGIGRIVRNSLAVRKTNPYSVILINESASIGCSGRNGVNTESISNFCSEGRGRSCICTIYAIPAQQQLLKVWLLKQKH